MSARPSVRTCFCLVALAASITAQTRGTSGSSNYDIAEFHNLMIPTRDGVHLATNVYRPAENGKVVEGKFPVILERTPYGKDNDVYYANHWVKQGYVVILQDVRGRFNSEGTWQFFRDDINDGYDTAKWIGSQPWSNCAIGTVGASYPGGTQHALALSNAPCLKAMIPAYATTDAGRVGLRGTTTLLAALNAANGEVFGLCQERHRHQEWLKFLRRIDQTIPPALELHVICDNYSTHKHDQVQRWLDRHPRFPMHFTPTGSSWLNMVERFFRDLSQNRLRRGVSRDVEELITAIETYIDHHNDNPKPFIWTARAADILEKVKRARRTLNKRRSE